MTGFQNFLNQHINLFLGGNDWFVENKLSIADFAIWELIDTTRYVMLKVISNMTFYLI